LASSSASPVNGLIRDTLIEGRAAEQKYEKDGYAVKWTFVNDLELIFVVRRFPLLSLLIRKTSHFKVAYQRILQLTYVDDLLGALKTVFVKLFQPFVAAFVASLHAVNSSAVALSNSASDPIRWNFAKAFEGWDAAFDKLLKGLENKAAEVCSCP
jgi:signal recognition particle receptor subunit alpha